jgi:sec-independent protein translocase protein TatB
MTPRAALTKHLLDGDDSIFTGRFDDNGSSSANGTPAVAADPTPTQKTPPTPPASQASTQPAPAQTPFDPDAT